MLGLLDFQLVVWQLLEFPEVLELPKVFACGTGLELNGLKLCFMLPPF